MKYLIIKAEISRIIAIFAQIKRNTMKKSYIFLADGFEEVEALATADVLRRCGMDVALVSIYGEPTVTGANGITAVADEVFCDVDFADADWLICPGGMPGATNLYSYAPLANLLKKHAAAGGRIAAICASPAVVLSQLGLLKGKNATCYPGFESLLAQHGAIHHSTRVVTDGNIITGNGPSSAIPFGLAIAAATVGADVAQQVHNGMLC